MTRKLAAEPTRIAGGFHALSDATRVEIVDLLRGGERCVCELMDALDAAQSRLSFHLKVLREAGLVTDRKDGRWVYYTLNADVLGELQEFLSHVTAGSVLSLARPQNARACCD